MSPGGFEHKRVLVVDDFDNFRTMVTRMLQEFGAHSVDTAVNGKEAVAKCRSAYYDLVLCDYNLGPGKSGQQVLEQLRYEKLLKHSSLFVLISAESSKSIVMAAYDYEPDAYLTKPITANTLQQRLSRLFHQRFEMRKVYKALDEDDLDAAITRCGELLREQTRVRPLVQKLLGRLLLQTKQYSAAEQLYRKVLQIREIDWAMVGVAMAKKGLDDWVGAQQWVEQAISQNAMCMPAYDLLAEIQGIRGDTREQQDTLMQAVEISPFSIVRQQKLGDLAYQNHDLAQAARAFKNSIKLGEHSCYDRKSVHLQFVRSCSELARVDADEAKKYNRDVRKTIAGFEGRFGSDEHNRLLIGSVACAYQAATGEKEAAENMLTKMLEQKASEAELRVQLDWIFTCETLGNQPLYEKLVDNVLQQYQGDEKSLEQIDRVLENPVSEKNKKRVAEVNKQGITCYDNGDFSGAINCFRRAVQDFPKHVGIQLNLLQAIVGALEEGQTSELGQARLVIDRLQEMMPAGHSQTDRFVQLVNRVRELSRKSGPVEREND